MHVHCSLDIWKMGNISVAAKQLAVTTNRNAKHLARRKLDVSGSVIEEIILWIVCRSFFIVLKDTLIRDNGIVQDSIDTLHTRPVKGK